MQIIYWTRGGVRDFGFLFISEYLVAYFVSIVVRMRFLYCNSTDDDSLSVENVWWLRNIKLKLLTVVPIFFDHSKN